MSKFSGIRKFWNFTVNSDSDLSSLIPFTVNVLKTQTPKKCFYYPKNQARNASSRCRWNGVVQSDLSLVVRKLVFGVSDQVPHKRGCTATEKMARSLKFRI